MKKNILIAVLMIFQMFESTANAVHDKPTPISPQRIMINTNNIVGKADGYGSVTPTGAATYVLPLSIPHDEFGYCPDLQIVYNSMARNGILGHGWTLSCSSSISRCGSTIFYDGTAKEVQLTNEDNLCCDGKRLVLISGNNLSDGSIYNFEDDPSQKIVRYNSGFKVYKKNGTVDLYGTTSDSRVGFMTGKWMWLIKKSTDLRGKSITYSYTSTSIFNDYRLSRIDYETDKSVVFSYESRPDGEVKFFAGQFVASDRRLKSISIYVKDSLVNKYQFSYEYDGFLSKLSSITFYGQDDLCYNPTQIEYGSSSLSYNVQAPFSTNKNGDRVQYGDFNGDGRMDFLSLPIKQNYSSSDSVYIYLSRGSGIGMNFEMIGSLQLDASFCDVYISDTYGDGHPCITIVRKMSNKGCHTCYSVEGTAIAYRGYFEIDRGTFLEGDYNGDGRTEFLNMLNKKVYDSNGTIIATASELNWNDAYRPDVFSIKKTLDFNGNGKEDVLVIGNNGLALYELKNDIISEVTSFATTDITSSSSIVCGDFNGDGYTDLLSRNGTQCTVYLSTGLNFVSSHTFTTIADLPVMVGDFNGDGKSDLFHLGMENGNYKFVIEVSKGTSFITFSSAAPVHPGMNGGTNLFHYFSTIADFDGDGRTEYGCFYFSDKAVIKHFSDDQNLRVSRITDGLGKRTIFEYALSSNTQVCTNNNAVCQYPVAKLSQPLNLVSSITVSDGTAWYSAVYKYKNPYIHLQGKGFLGFEETTLTDDMEKVVSTYGFHPELAFPYLSSQTIQTSGGLPVSRKYYLFAANMLSNSRPYRFVPYLRTEVLIDSLTGNERQREVFIDNFGNPSMIAVSYGGNHTDTIVTSYCNSTGTVWAIGLPQETTISTYDGSCCWKETERTDYNERMLPIRNRKYVNNQSIPVMDETLAYDINGNVTSRSVKQYNSASLTTSYTYSADGQKLYSVTDPYSQTTSYQYDSLGRVMRTDYPTGLTTVCEYDRMGRLIQKSNNDSTFLTIGYGWNHSLVNSVLERTISYSDGREEQTIYDASGRQLQESRLDFQGNWLKQWTCYDMFGRFAGKSLPFKGNQTSSWDGIVYDAYGRVSQESHANGSVITYAYSGNTVSTTEEGISTMRTFDNRGRLIRASQPSGDICYTLRPDGQPSEIVSSGIITTFGYDNYGRQNALNDPSTGIRSCTYGENGCIQSKTDADGRSVTFLYDALGRLTREERAEMTTDYIYDTHNRLSSVASSNGTGTQYFYDGLGRKTAYKNLLPDGRYLLREYTYSQGSVSSVKYSSQTTELGTEHFAYRFGNLYDITFGQKLIWRQMAENDMGQCTNSASATINRVSSYDEYGTPTGISMSNGNTTYQNQQFSYDSNTGNLSWRKDGKRLLQENFGYDNLNRLTSYHGGTIDYDNKGNILQKSDASLVMSYGNNASPYAITGVEQGFSPFSVRYADQRIVYNSFECPDSIIDNGTITDFLYNAQGQRVMMRTNKTSLPTRYYVDNKYEEEYAGDGHHVYRLYLGGDAYSAPAVYVSSVTGDSLYYLGRDQLGSITHVVNEEGSLLREYSYDAWGRLCDPTNHEVYNVDTEPALFLGRGYCGHEHLQWCGLINMNARLYDPILGRFLGPDPFIQIGDNLQNYNRYSYCLNNPLKYTDPNGEFIFTFITALGDLIGNVVKHGFNSSQYNWTKTKNAWQIDAAPFRGNPMNVLSNLTWGIPNTVVGNLIGHFTNLSGMADGVSQLDGLTAIGGITPGNSAFTIGPYSFGPSNYRATWKDHLFVHEYGHYIQHLYWGATYIPIIACTSLTSAFAARLGYGNHTSRWFEIDASNKGARYFDRHYGRGSARYQNAVASGQQIDLKDFFERSAFETGDDSHYSNPRKKDFNRKAFPTSLSLGSFQLWDFVVPLSIVSLFFWV